MWSRGQDSFFFFIEISSCLHYLRRMNFHLENFKVKSVSIWCLCGNTVLSVYFFWSLLYLSHWRSESRIDSRIAQLVTVIHQCHRQRRAKYFFQMRDKSALTQYIIVLYFTLLTRKAFCHSPTAGCSDSQLADHHINVRCFLETPFHSLPCSRLWSCGWVPVSGMWVDVTCAIGLAHEDLLWPCLLGWI